MISNHHSDSKQCSMESNFLVYPRIMGLKTIENELNDLFPSGEWIRTDHGRESFCPYFTVKTWFLEFLVFQKNPETNSLDVLLDFHFNWNHTEKNNFRRAQAMGLLPYHFYSRLETRIGELDLELLYNQNPDFSTKFILEAANPQSLKNKIQQVEANHLEITKTALKCLHEIAEKYSLG